jgi:hypothetical protein
VRRRLHLTLFQQSTVLVRRAGSVLENSLGYGNRRGTRQGKCALWPIFTPALIRGFSRLLITGSSFKRLAAVMGRVSRLRAK